MAFVSTSIFQKALTLAQNEGLSLHKLHLHVNRLASIEGKKYLPMDWLLDLYEQAGEELPSGFGLRQGIQLNADDYGTLGLSWKTCWTAREVLARTERFMVLVTDKGSAKITENDETVCVHLYRDTTRPGLSTANEATFVMLTGILEEVTGTSIMPVEVSFQHRLKDKTQFVSYFRGPVFDNQKGNFIKFNLIDVNVPTIKADRSLQAFLLERMEEERDAIQVNNDRLLNEMQVLIQEALPSGIPSSLQLAEYLGMSVRTLKRRLSEKGHTFRDLVQAIQKDLSIKLLKNSSHTVGEIAFQTGFSEQSAFNRAFKRWTGVAPSEYRKGIIS